MSQSLNSIRQFDIATAATLCLLTETGLHAHVRGRISSDLSLKDLAGMCEREVSFIYSTGPDSLQPLGALLDRCSLGIIYDENELTLVRQFEALERKLLGMPNLGEIRARAFALREGCPEAIAAQIVRLARATRPQARQAVIDASDTATGDALGYGLSVRFSVQLADICSFRAALAGEQEITSADVVHLFAQAAHHRLPGSTEAVARALDVVLELNKAA